MKYLLITFLIFLNLNSFSQKQLIDSIYLNRVEKQGLIMTKFFLDKDYKGFTKYVYQPSLDILGGEEIAIQTIEKAVDKLSKDGFYISNCSVEKPANIILFNNEFQCTLIENIEMKVIKDGLFKGRLVSKSILIGISKNNGEDWTFIETSGKPLTTLRSTFKNLSDNLIIPEETYPVFYGK
jgi:hypothetical protein